MNKLKNTVKKYFYSQGKMFTLLLICVNKSIIINRYLYYYCIQLLFFEKSCKLYKHYKQFIVIFCLFYHHNNDIKNIVNEYVFFIFLITFSNYWFSTTLIFCYL